MGNKSLQITRLLSYLIANKDSEVSKDKLIDILWPEETSANPSGALRNLVYRATDTGIELLLFRVRFIHAKVRHRHETIGTFYCNFDIFKNIYQINAPYAAPRASVFLCC